MACPPHKFKKVPGSGPKIAGFRCESCAATFDPLPVVSADGNHTLWFGGKRSPALEALMSSADFVENLERYDGAIPQPPLWEGIFYVGKDL